MPSVNKPKVYLVGTGGTISSIGADRRTTPKYSYMSNKLTIHEMLAKGTGGRRDCRYSSRAVFEFG
ncbi:MAG: hypothetical protein CM1200mP22_00320 [Dehalococcoidia bacterium]|nr:MAG: hypothetical protein CM1200mP22_00320 [Dehalococcoidia bacterium]